MGPCESPNAWFSASAVGSKLFFSKLLTYKGAYMGVKITVMREPPDRSHDISHFPIGPKANGNRGCTHFHAPVTHTLTDPADGT